MSPRPTPTRLDPLVAPHRVVTDDIDAPPTWRDQGVSAAYIGVLLQRWRLVLALTLAGALAGGIASRLVRPVYATGVTLAVAEPKIGGGDRETRTSARDYLALLENRALAADTIRQFKLDQPPYNLGPETFLLRILQTEQIGQTNLLRLVVRLPDPKLASDIANHMAARVQNLTQRLTSEETSQARLTLSSQLTEARTRLDQAQTLLEAARTGGQYDLLKRDVDILLEQRRELRGVTVKIAGERASLARAEAELARRSRIDLLTRTIENDNILREAARESGGRNLIGLSVKNEFVNVGYDDLDKKVSESRSLLSSLEQQRDQYARVSGLDKPTLDKLTQLYALETRVSRLELELELARRVYLETALAHEQVRMQVSSRSPMLQIVDPALVPERPEPRYTARNAGVGGLAGALLGMLVAFFSQRPRTQPA
jgi:uncharacterized protein involved in exopolysaccharide biosynthesis